MSLYLTLKTTIYHSGIYLELHSITSQHTGITLLPEGGANPPINKEIIGLVPSRIDQVPLTSLAWFKVMVLQAQWRHRNFLLFERTSCSWLEPAVIDIIPRSMLSFLLMEMWFWRRHLQRAPKLCQRWAGLSPITLFKMFKLLSSVWLTIPQVAGVTSILITYDNATQFELSNWVHSAKLSGSKIPLDIKGIE